MFVPLELPGDMRGMIAEFAPVRSPSATCMRELFDSMGWDASKEGDEDDEGFIFNLCDWRKDPYGYLVGACHLTQFTMPENPSSAGTAEEIGGLTILITSPNLWLLSTDGLITALMTGLITAGMSDHRLECVRVPTKFPHILKRRGYANSSATGNNHEGDRCIDAHVNKTQLCCPCEQW